VSEAVEIGRAAVEGYGFARAVTIDPAAKSPTEYWLLGGADTARGAHDDEADPCARPHEADTAGRLHIGLVRIGGIGDDLTTLAGATAIKRRFPHAHITAFLRDGPGVAAGHPALDRVVYGCGQHWRGIVRELRQRFDIFYDLRYVARVWVYHPDYRAYAEECAAAFERRAWYYDNWYASNRSLADLAAHVVDVTNHAICCPGSIRDMRIALRREDRKLAALMAGRPYATVHDGCAAGITKLWPREHWEELVEALRSADLEVVQIGSAADRERPAIYGVSHDMRGLTTLRETAGLLAGAALCVDTEGGMVHLAHAVGQRHVVVLYGPTPQVCFGYPGHAAVVTPVECRGCWYAAPDWHVRCPREAPLREHAEFARPADIPRCMRAITPDAVLAAARDVLARGCASANDKRDAPFDGVKVCRMLAPCRPSRQRPVLPVSVAIPTRNRPHYLARLLASLAVQDAIPHEVIIVDDNDEPGLVPEHWDGGAPVRVVRGPRAGPARAHQTALDHATQPWVLRFDDDLVLEAPDFLSRLYRLAASGDGVAAVGGVYPQPGSGGARRAADIGKPGLSVTVEAMLRGEPSAQFYRYDEARVVEAEHLYSSFLYDAALARRVGGHSIWYSRQGHREETDFTMRLRAAGRRLLIDTGAVARHERAAQGGLREVAAEHRQRMDDEQFRARLAAGAFGAHLEN
jgi:ADP-heptose:LPS heptosyltransferase/GT2 family glycosyltransferase